MNFRHVLAGIFAVGILAVGMVAVGILADPALLRASAPQAAPGTPDEVFAVKQFDQAVVEYMALRQRLRGEVSGPVKDSTSTQLTDASDALAAAIQRARPKARVGGFFTAPVAAVFKRRVADTVRTEKLTTVLTKIDDDDEAVSAPPKIYVRMPVSEQMATMPPALLAILPPLPKELEYRILGGYLLLRDVDASLVLDYIPAAVPR